MDFMECCRVSWQCLSTELFCCLRVPCSGSVELPLVDEQQKYPPMVFVWRKSLVPFVLSLHGNRYFTEVKVGCSLACGF